MNSCLSPCDSERLMHRLRMAATDAGAVAFGAVSVRPVSTAEAEAYDAWIAEGCHGEMTYLERYPDIRRNPALLFEGARTMFVAAFSYQPTLRQPAGAPRFADYALGRDYHDVVRERLRTVASLLDGATRICVDTAPLRERLWAAHAGIGFIGRNCQLIVPGYGSKVFLGEILWDGALSVPDPEPMACLCPDGCRRCIDACPGNALRGNGTLDARRCLSYLTIEYRGELPDGLRLGGRIYGCDACQNACPFNAGIPATQIADFTPSERLLDLDAAEIAAMAPDEFSAVFRHSAVKRTRLDGLRRNLSRL